MEKTQDSIADLFPVSDYKVIKPYLEVYYSFMEPLIYSELIINYCDYMNDPLGNKAIHDVIKNYKGSFIVDNPVFECKDKDNLQTLMESVLSISKKIYIEFDKDFPQRFEKFVRNNIKNRIEDLDIELPEYNDKIEKYRTLTMCLFFMGYIVHKYKLDNNFDLDMNIIGSVSMNYYQYKSSVRPDLFELYKFLHKLTNSKTKALTITIDGKDEKIKLKNEGDWFSKALTPFLDIFLETKSLQEVREVSKREKNENIVLGRNAKELLNWMVRGTYKLIKNHAPFSNSKIGLTQEETRFIYDYIRCLGIIEYADHQRDTDKIRRIIQSHQPKKSKFSWVWLPPHIDNPNDIRITYPWA